MGFYVIRFELQNDYVQVLMRGPWKLFDHYLTIQIWKPNFEPMTESITSMIVWVQLPRFLVEYFGDDAIKMITECIGKPLKLDLTTSTVERGRFTRVAVEIALDKPLVSQVWVHNRLQRVEYEVLHVVCFACGAVSHRSTECNARKVAKGTSTASARGEGVDMDVEKTIPTSEDKATTTATSSKSRFRAWILVNWKPKYHLRKLAKST